MPPRKPVQKPFPSTSLEREAVRAAAERRRATPTTPNSARNMINAAFDPEVETLVAYKARLEKTLAILRSLGLELADPEDVVREKMVHAEFGQYVRDFPDDSELQRITWLKRGYVQSAMNKADPRRGTEREAYEFLLRIFGVDVGIGGRNQFGRWIWSPTS